MPALLNYKSGTKFFKTAYRFLGLFILVYLLFQLDFQVLVYNLVHMNGWLLLLSILLVFPMVAGKAWRWKLFLSDQGIEISFSQSMIVYFKGFGLGSITPAQVGELIKIYEIRKLKPDASKTVVLGTIVNDRFYDLAGLVLFCFPCLFLFVNLHVWFKIPALLIAVTLVVNPNLFLQFTRFRFNHRLVTNTILTIFISCLVVFRGVLIFLALGIKIPAPIVAVYLPCINVISLLPISISGFGTREAVMLYVFRPWNIPGEELVLAGLLMGVVFFVLNGLLGSIVMFWKK